MAAESSLTLKIKGEDAASHVLHKVASEVEGAGHKVEESEGRFSKFSETLKDVGKVAAGFVLGSAIKDLGAGAGEQLQSLVTDTMQWGEQVRVLAQNTGMSAEQASTWTLAMKDQGIQIDAGSMALTRLAKGLPQVDAATGKTFGGTKLVTGALTAMGVEFAATGGKAVPMGAIMDQVADKFKTMPDGMEKSSAAMSLFGRAGAQLIPLLNLGKEGLDEVSKEAKKYGLQLSGDNVASIRKFALAHNEMDAAVEGAKMQIGLALMPALTNLSGALTEGVVHVKGWMNAFSKTDTFASLKGIMETVGMALGKVVDMVKALASGDANSFFLALSQGFAGVGGNADQFQDALVGVTNFLFGTLPDAIGDAATTLGQLKKALVPVTEAFIGLLAQNWKPILAVVAAFVVLQTVVLPLVGVVTTVIGVFTTLIGVASAVGAAFSVGGMGAGIGAIVALLGGPVTLVILGIVAVVALLTAAWKNNWGDIQGKTQAVVSFFQKLPSTIGGIFNEVGTKVSGFATTVGTFFSGLGSKIHAAVQGILGWLGTWWPLILVVLTGPIGIAVVQIINHWQQIQQFTATIWNLIWGTITHFVQVIFDALVQAGTRFFKAIQTGWKVITDAYEAFLKPIIVKVVGFAGHIIDQLKILATNALHEAQKIGGAILQGIEQAIQAGWSALTGLVGKVAKSLLDAAKSSLGIHSPSALFAQVGQDIMAGLQQGLLTGHPAVEATLVTHMQGLPAAAAGGTLTGAAVTPAGGGNMAQLLAEIRGLRSDLGSGTAQLVVDGQVLATVTRKYLLRQGNSLTALGLA